MFHLALGFFLCSIDVKMGAFVLRGMRYGRGMTLVYYLLMIGREMIYWKKETSQGLLSSKLN